MSKIIVPDYDNIARVDTVFADKAQQLLAHIELRNMNISDPDEFNNLYEEKLAAAGDVLFHAIDCGPLEYEPIPGSQHFSTNKFGERGYHFNLIKFRTSDFCNWAYKRNYNLPDALFSLTDKFANQEVEKTIIAEGAKITEALRSEKDAQNNKEKQNDGPDKESPKVIENLLKMVIAMAKDCYGYNPSLSKKHSSL